MITTYTSPAPWTCGKCDTRVAAHLPHSCSVTPEPEGRAWLTDEQVRELVSFEMRRLLGSPHAFTALADRVVALEGRLEETHPYASFIREVVREEMEEVIERALGSLLQGLLAGKFPQYREADPLDG